MSGPSEEREAQLEGEGGAPDAREGAEDLGAAPEASEPSGARRGALILLAGGMLTGAGLLVFPDSLLETSAGARGPHGLPLWTLGLILIAAGIWEIALRRSSALTAAVGRRPILPVLLGLGVLAALVLLTYR